MKPKIKQRIQCKYNHLLASFLRLRFSPRTSIMNIKSEILRHDTIYETNNNGGPTKHLQIRFMCSLLIRRYIFKCIVRICFVHVSLLNETQSFFAQILQWNLYGWSAIVDPISGIHLFKIQHLKQRNSCKMKLFLRITYSMYSNDALNDGYCCKWCG